MHKLTVRLADTLFVAVAAFVLSGLWPKRRLRTLRERLEEWMKAAEPDWRLLRWELGGPRSLFQLAYEMRDEHIAACEHCRIHRGIGSGRYHTIFSHQPIVKRRARR